MHRPVLAAILLVACGSPPASICRSNDDCPIDRVCLAGACATPSALDAGAPDAASGDGGGTDGARADAPSGPLPGESCASAILLRPVAEEGGEIATATWTGEIGRYTDDGYPDCTGPDIGAPDVFFEIERPMDTRDLIITTSPSDLDTVMALDGSCDGHLAWLCNDDRDAEPDGGGDLSSALFLWHYDPSVSERLFLIVDGGRASTLGVVTVQVEVRAPSSADCSDPLDLAGGGAVLAFPSTMAPGNQGDCSAVIGGDVLFRAGSSGGRFAVESSDFPVSLRLIDSMCGASIMCAPTMGDDAYHFTSLSPAVSSGYGFIAVEGISSRMGGTFQLDYNP
jgi:hypothetical protein